MFRRRFESDLDAELRSHLEMAVERNLRRGLSPDEARRDAWRQLGGMNQVKEICRDEKGSPMIDATLQDLRYGVRMLLRSPGFSLLAILCLTIGIGANAAVFSWIEGTLLRPYPLVADQDRMVVLGGTNRGDTGFHGLSWPDLLDFRKNCTLFDTFIAEKISGSTLSVGDRAERATGSVVSANYFDALGVHPVIGRGFEPAEETGRNGHPVVVISYNTWKIRFKSDPGVLGKTQVLNGLPHTIVGVAPEGFYGTFVGYSWDFWVPAGMQERFEPGGYKMEDRGAHWIEGFARLKPGVSRDQAQAEISAVAKRLENDYPATNRGRDIRLMPLWESPFNAETILRPTLGMALAVVVFVLLVACVNVANLLLVRSVTRRHEMTVRLAIGAGRARLVRQLFTEGLILAGIGTAAGLLVARWCREAIILAIPASSAPLHMSGSIDWRVMALSAAVAMISTLVAGLVPAIQGSKIDLSGALKSETGSVVGGHGRSWLRSSLVVAQGSMSFILLTGAGLLIRSLREIRNTSPGFSPATLTSVLDLFAAGYDAERAKHVQDELMDRLQTLGGVDSVAMSRIRPFTYRSFSTAPIAVDGYEAPPNEQPTADYNEVSPAYFVTTGIPLVAGREFTRADDESAPLVAVVNETMASQYWRGADPVGRRVQVKGHWMQVVGVAKDTKYMTLTESPKPFFYVPLRQNFAAQAILYIRTQQNAPTMSKALAREIHALDPDLAAYELISMGEQVERKGSSQQAVAAVVGIFCGLALFLAAIGLYGIMAYTVSQSARELALRMALGADARDLLRLVMTHGAKLTGGGVLLGAAVALGTTRLLGYLLFHVSPRDPLSFGLAFVAMSLVSIAACFVPAWRASRTDPVRALRE